MNETFIDSLVLTNTTKMVFLVLDGLGGYPFDETGRTELEAADTPNLDALTRASICGMLDPIAPGVTPGSGPSQLALLGYDPFQHQIGRGLLSALGIDFPLTEWDLAARANFATVDEEGVLIDRRAGRLTTEENRRLAEKIQKSVKLPVEFFFLTESDHRAVFILRGEHLSPEIQETDPQVIGEKPLPPQALTAKGERTAELVTDFLIQVRNLLRNEKKANFLLLRGFDKCQKIPSIGDRFKLKALTIAQYPMYRGLSRLLGMDVSRIPRNLDEKIDIFLEEYENYDLFHILFKQTDTFGEDRDVAGKIAAIEAVDRVIPRIRERSPDVIVVTGDHSTPAAMGTHSWHPVPLLLHSRWCRPDGVTEFHERACIHGGLGRMPMVHVMPLALANARRLRKYRA
ncbi:MAG: 2,3-bisphosphoglycerate-independent phosphoglycerate mutase [Deltaproteobacteria bacterium]|nr:MAG: 2,3-bisphosphoglycerate-independent phosphoglycerate mutase [Deltaproteobacteria bacterium]